MIDYLLRPVREGDWVFWRELHHAAERETIVRQFGQWDEALQDKFARQAFEDTEGERAVIVVDGKDVGWWHLKPRGDALFLHQIILHPSMQRRGIGSALIKNAIARAQREKKALTLQTLLENTAKGLYEKMGFVVTEKGDTHWQMRWGAR